MRRLLFTASIFVLVLWINPAQAQTSQPACDPATAIKLANSIKSTGDTAKDMDALLKLRDTINQAHIACSGLTFSGGKGEKVLDPVTIPDGTYRVKGTMKSLNLYANITKKTLSGNCDTWSLSFVKDRLVTEDTADMKACRMAIKVYATDDWTLTFEPLQ